MRCCVCGKDIEGIGRSSAEKCRKHNPLGIKVFMHQDRCWQLFFTAVKFERMNIRGNRLVIALKDAV